VGEPTYGIVAALFREAYQVRPDDSPRTVRQKLATGLHALGAPDAEAESVAPMLDYVLGLDETRSHHLEPEQLKRQIALVARALFERRLRQAPLLIVVEDLHWADSASIGLLCEITEHLADQSLMMLLSHRADTRLSELARPAQPAIELGPLSADETHELVGRLFGTVGGDTFPQVEAFIADRAGGNPLFVEEIVRSLVDGGVLARQGDRWMCTAACEALDVPPTLHGLLMSRVDRLPADIRRLLQEAAALGIEFDQALLLAIACDPAAAQSALDHPIDAELIEPIGREGERSRYRFSHALVHDVVYRNLLLTRRSELHERIGGALERAVGTEAQRLSDLAALGHHWSLAADKRKGARYLMAAGDRARAVYANADAMRHYDSALRTLAECRACDEEVRVVRERLADLLALGGRRAEALAHYEAVRQELESGTDATGAARLHRKIGGLYWETGDRERAAACFATGLERLGTNGNATERAQLFEEIGRLAFRAGDNAGAIAWAERALAEASDKEAGNGGERVRETAATRAQAYNTRGVALARAGRLSEAVVEIERSIGLAEAHDLIHVACRGYANLGVLYGSLDPCRSIETSLRGLETAKRAGDLGFQSRLYANLAVAYCALTDRCEDEGISAAQTAADLDRRLGLLDHLAVPLIVLGQIQQCRGDRESAFASYTEALDLAERAGEPQLLFPCYDGLATLYLDAGDQTLAETYLAKSQELCDRAGLKPDTLMILPFLC
jgi:adenylate cyclase